MKLPLFKYHPDPVGTGSLERSDGECRCCGRRRGYVYMGPVFAEEDLAEALCPWCIADGSAHEKFDASFTDEAGIGGEEASEPLPEKIVEQVAYRTPGFSGWQQERWLVCCGDAAAFVGRAGAAELRDRFPEVIASLRESSGMGDAWPAYFEALSRDGNPTAYVFRCLHCGRHVGYTDGL